jgi:triphosphoribosyl-dephospho-CoA synthase
MSDEHHYGAAMALRTACIWEATARKVGNVHRYADFHDSTYLDFILSAGVVGDHLAHVDGTLGASILRTVQMTRTLVGTNTNLGIILLLAPLARVWTEPDRCTCRRELEDLLAKLTIDDARHVYKAIRLANPGGLGEAAQEDIRSEPTVTLRDAMRLAADRDIVARQYASGYAEVLEFGVSALLRAFARFQSVEAAIIDAQLLWLATFPDSLIARKNGPAIADDVRHRAAGVVDLGGIATRAGCAAGVALDVYLRRDGNRLNPGTTADLVTASLFIALRENKVTPSAPFKWNTADWL